MTDPDGKIADLMSAAGIRQRLTDETKSSVISALILNNSKIQKQPMFEEFWRGAESLGLKTILQNHPGMTNSFSTNKMYSFNRF